MESIFIAALRDAAGNITNYVGVQCQVSDQYASTVCKRQEEMDANSAKNNNSGDRRVHESSCGVINS